MRLFQEMQKVCRLCCIQREPDGSGGQIETCSCGERFKAAVIRDSSSDPDQGEKKAELALYIVTTDRELDFGVVFAVPTESECKRFRIVSSGIQPPEFATFRFRQYRAEEYK